MSSVAGVEARSRTPKAGRRSVTYGFWPSPTQELLLDAALRQDEGALHAFSAWESRVDFDRLDGASVRLLPLLYHNLMALGASDRTRLIGRLRGIHRQTWYKNQLLLGMLSEVLARFSRAGIPTLALKGVPLSLCYYPALAARPMSDADLLIPERNAPAVLDIMHAAGFHPNFPEGDWPPRVTAARAFVHRDGWEIDLHTRVMHECWAADADADFWTAAVPFDVGAAPILTLAPEDHVLHLLAHGVRRNHLPPVRWVADVVMVIRHRERRFDWSRLADQARRRRMSLLVRSALAYLAGRFQIEVPTTILSQLTSESMGIAEQFEFRARLVPGTAGFAAGAFADYLRMRGRDRTWQGALGFVHYVRDHYRLESSWQVPMAIGRRVLGCRGRK